MTAFNFALTANLSLCYLWNS